mmetsp:Transcript_12825/g.19214  ORF Transcript_12825/g.19214 Transcript_12825/m.19214 type:complete len:81 (+) Transcript_12825:87-329(+)
MIAGQSLLRILYANRARFALLCPISLPSLADDVRTSKKEPKIILLGRNYHDTCIHASNNLRLVQQAVFRILTQRMQRAFV